jgi:hypothetical protein
LRFVVTGVVEVSAPVFAGAVSAVLGVDAVSESVWAFSPQPATSAAEKNAAMAARVTPMLQSPKPAPAEQTDATSIRPDP